MCICASLLEYPSLRALTPLSRPPYPYLLPPTPTATPPPPPRCTNQFPIRLEGLADVHQKFCSYEPELFPGLVYRMHQPKIVLLIFVSGKVVLTGGKSPENLYDGFKKIYPILCRFSKHQITARVGTAS